MKLKITTQKMLSKESIFKKAGLLLLALSGFSASAQDTCATALPITAGTTTVAAINGSNIQTACSTAAMAEWYVYTPTSNYSVTVTSDLPINICKDTHFMVYTGNCGALTCYTNDDDSGIIACNTGAATSYLSVKTFEVTAGVNYYIVWDNKWSALGFDFQISEGPIVPSPCSTATPVTAGVTTVAAVNGTNQVTSCSTATKAQWYAYTPTQNVRVTVSSDLPQNLCKDTFVSVYTGSCSTTLTCVASDDNSGVLECTTTTPATSNLSKRTFDANAGTTYYIAWDNRWSEEGFDFEISETVIVIPVTYTSQTISTIGSGYSECVVDMNGDYKDDIVTVNGANLRLNLQGDSGALTTADYTIANPGFAPSWSIAAGDYNRDGYNDLLLGSGSGLTFWQSQAGAGYTSVTPGQYIFCQRTNFVDINNDGNLDAFSCHDVNRNVYYLLDNNNTFTYYQSGVTPGAYNLGLTQSGGNYASLWTDYDNDGDVDMFISKCSGPPCELHRNDGNGVFTDVSAQAGINFTPVQSWSSAIADFDNDGDMDIIVGSNGSVATRYFKNNLDTTNNVEEAFTNITAGSGWELNTATNRDYIAYDFDNDGWIDVMGPSGRIMFNTGDGNFSMVNYSNGISVGAVGDLNGDGFLDVLNNTIVRYANPNGNHWVAVSLAGIQSNINGIGARVEIYGAFGKQIRDIRSGEGFGYMSTLNAHFGLGANTNVDKLVIKWPSGAEDTIMNPGIDKTIHVTEGESLLANNQFDAQSFVIAPNPASDLISVQLGSALSKVKSVEVYDISGRMVMNNSLVTETISVKELASGTYILTLKTIDGRSFTQKFIKK